MRNNISSLLDDIDEVLRKVGDHIGEVTEVIANKYPNDGLFTDYGTKADLDNAMMRLDSISWELCKLVFHIARQPLTPEADAKTVETVGKSLAVLDKPRSIPVSDDPDTVLAADALHYAQQRIASLRQRMMQ